MKRQQPGYWPLHPFVVATLPVVHFYLGNFRMLEPGDGARILLTYLTLTALALTVGRLVWKNVHRAALVVSPVLLVFFKGSVLGESVSLVLLTAAAVGGILLRFRPFDARKVTLPLNMAALVFLALPLARIGWAEFKNAPPVPVAQAETEALNLTVPRSQHPPPDIYYLLVDGLGQPDFLDKHYSLPEGALRQILTEHGFRVLERSRGSYPQTALAAASTLNLGYLQDLLDIPDPENFDRRVLRQLVGTNRATVALHEAGYAVGSFPSGYPVTRLATPDHRWQPRLNPSFLEYYVLDDGLLPLLQRWSGRGPADISHGLRRHRLEYIFDHLPEARRGLPESQPLFVFAHILAPHPPFVFDASGQALNPPVKFGFADGSHWRAIHQSDADAYRALYSAQFGYVMQRLGEAVAGILAQSPRPPVIIIQGDHGPGSALDWEDAGATDLPERFGIYNAWYVPPGVDISLHDDEMAVNTFAVLFNGLFGLDLEPLPQECWFAPSSRPYRFGEVLR
ncbi:MAG: hypothetical protein QNL91_12990 [Candidatus Krumholzibacteria bacterium]|nr:hypothetical protein [Candidatus Krumholzibacteria bacterium]